MLCETAPQLGHGSELPETVLSLAFHTAGQHTEIVLAHLLVAAQPKADEWGPTPMQTVHLCSSMLICLVSDPYSPLMRLR